MVLSGGSWPAVQWAPGCVCPPPDVDECSLEYSPCSQLCSNTLGAFSCACLQGYTLRHGTTCEVAGRLYGEPRLPEGLGNAPR